MKNFTLLMAVAAIFMLFPLQVNSTHISGMDLTLTNVGGNDYVIRLAFYRDCSGISAPTTVAFVIQCTSDPTMNFNLTGIPQIPGTGQEITPACPLMGTTCSNGFLYGYQEYVFEVTVTLPPCNEWRVGWSGTSPALLGYCCRNPSNTIISPISQNAYMEVRLNNLDAPGSSTPSFTQIPILNLCVQQTQCFNMGAIDPNGDSLSYSLITPMTNGNSGAVTWVVPYTAQQPFPSSPLITMDAVTGNLCMTPTMNIISPMAMRVEKWRHLSGIPTLVGTIYRDIQIQSLVCNNQLPALSGMDTTMTNGYNTNDTLFLMELCVGDTVQFTIWGHDPDTANAQFGDRHLFAISWNNGIPQGNFQPLYNNTDSARATFTWFPGPNDVSNIPHCFTATIADGACPLNGVQMYGYCVLVKGFLINAGIDTLACQGETVTFNATTTVNTDMYQWFLNGVPTGPPSNQSTFTLQTINLTPGKHHISVESPNPSTPQCPGKGQVIAEVVYQPDPDLGGDQVLTSNVPVILDAGQGTMYQWSTGDTTQTITVNVSGTYGVEVDGGYGTRCKGYDQVEIEYLIGIEENDRIHLTEISPNPTNGLIYIATGDDISQRVQVALFTSDGKRVYDFAGYPDTSPAGMITIDISHLNDGLYIIQITTTQGIINRKVVLKR